MSLFKTHTNAYVYYRVEMANQGNYHQPELRLTYELKCFDPKSTGGAGCTWSGRALFGKNIDDLIEGMKKEIEKDFPNHKIISCMPSYKIGIGYGYAL